MAMPLISSRRVQNTRVFNVQGERLGRIREVMIHKETGTVAYVSLAFGGVLGFGEKRFPAPWSVLKFDAARAGYVIPMDKERLKAAPGYDAQTLADDDVAWRENVHAFWGAEPYWR